MAAPSDDRNGVVVNRARSESTCDRLNKRSSELYGREEVQCSEFANSCEK